MKKDIEKLKRLADLSYQAADIYKEMASIIEKDDDSQEAIDRVTFLMGKLTLISSEIENMKW